MTRIAFVHGSFPAGGAERITIDIARHLSFLSEYEVFVYTTRVVEELMPEDIHNLLTIRSIPSQAAQSRRSRQIEKFIVADNRSSTGSRITLDKDENSPLPRAGLWAVGSGGRALSAWTAEGLHLPSPLTLGTGARSV